MKMPELTPQQVVELTLSAADQRTNQAHAEWLTAVQSSDPRVLVAATSLLTSDDEHRPAVIKALREAIISEIERKNTLHLIRTMEKLDASAARLGWYSLLLAAVGAVLAGVPLLQAFNVLPR
jgi:hypothetical protein